MKQFFTLFFSGALLFFTQAQSSTVLLGMTQFPGSGTIMNYFPGETALHSWFSFPTNSDNEGPPYTTLTVASDNKIYGLAAYDGPQSYGSLFVYNYYLNTYTVLAHFNDSTGIRPIGSLVQAYNGILYGLTSQGDTTDGGTIFSYTIGATAVHKLITLPANANPSGTMIQASDSMLYGFTQGDGANSGGTIFQYNITTNTYTVMYDLPAHAYPHGQLLEIGPDTLYGLTSGDNPIGGGTLFCYVVSQNAYNVLYSFDQFANPGSYLLHASNGLLYGLTNTDGTNYNGFTNDGTIFSYDLGTGNFSVVYNFGATGTDGTNPAGGLVQAADGMLYGTTNAGGVENGGTIFRLNPANNAYTTMAYLYNTSSASPYQGFLTEYAPVPVVLSSLHNDTVCAGSIATFSATSNDPTISVKWQASFNGQPFNNVSNGTGTYQFRATSNENGYRYRAIFTNNLSIDTTAPATLTVISSVNDTASVSGNVCSVNFSGAHYQWFSCPGSGAINGATQQTFTPTVNGEYKCIITFGTCHDTTKCVDVTDIGAGIDNITAAHFSLYPNPNSGSFILETDNEEVYDVEVLDMLGRTVETANKVAHKQLLNMQHTAPGIYIVSVMQNGKSLQRIKFSLER